MNDEQNAAIDRLRQCGEGRDPYRVPCRHNILEDESIVAELYLAEHPAEDAEPVTEEWLCSMGFELDPLHKRRSVMWGIVRIYPPCGPLDWHTAVCGVAVPTVRTRGDVRRLCAALGVELKSE